MDRLDKDFLEYYHLIGISDWHDMVILDRIANRLGQNVFSSRFMPVKSPYYKDCFCIIEVQQPMDALWQWFVYARGQLLKIMRENGRLKFAPMQVVTFWVGSYGYRHFGCVRDFVKTLKDSERYGSGSGGAMFKNTLKGMNVWKELLVGEMVNFAEGM